MVQEEKSMRKKNKVVLILLIVLALLVVVYFGLRTWNTKQEEKEEEKQEAAKVHVTDTSADDIVSLKFNVGNGDLEFSKEDDQWYYTPDKDFPLKQSYPDDMAETVGSITADRELSGGDSIDAYGLDDPAYTIEYTDVDGNTTELLFGDMTGDDYYVMLNGNDTVYTVASSVIELLNHTLDDMAQLDDYPSIGSGNLVKEVITQNGETTTYDSEDEDQAEDIAAVAGGLGAVTLSEAADYSVDDADLEKYGLDEASRITVEATYTQDDEDQLLTLYIGNEDGDGNRYVMINDSRIVYLISDEICDNILNV